MNSHNPKQYSVVALLLFTLIVAAGCKKPVPDDLQQAKNVIANILSPFELHNSMFPAAYPDCKPSEFVHYIFSDLGAIEMPESRPASAAKESGAGAIAGYIYTGLPWPEGVAMIPLSPDPQRGRQIVLKPDDEHAILTIELYEDPSQEAVAHFDVDVPKVTPTEMSRAAFQSNIQAGARF